MANVDLSELHAHIDLLQQRFLAFRLTQEPLFLSADQFYVADLNPKPNFDVSGAALFGYDADTHRLAVAVAAEGLETGRPHIEHIHGFANGQDAVEPTIAADTDGDGYIEGAEGAPFWGPVLLDMPTVTTEDGDIFVVETFQLPQQGLAADPQLALREYNIHGGTVPEGAGAGTPNEVNGVGGYKPGLVVTGGDVEAVESVKDMREFIRDSGFDDLARDALRERLASFTSGWML